MTWQHCVNPGSNATSTHPGPSYATPEAVQPKNRKNPLRWRWFLVGRADLDQLGDVDGVDLGLIVGEWLYWCPYDWPLR
ncbi:MAG: hypothetical protein ACYTE5_08115 [Planctomycetota bacterium]